MLYRQGADDSRHCIDSAILVQQLKKQLDDNIDRNCTPMGGCGASGAPFKVTCAAYGYTMVGKGTTSWLWPHVSREAEVYSVLQQAQGSAVPVFLGAINLAKIYFLHGAEEIRHMLLMVWGSVSVILATMRNYVLRLKGLSGKSVLSEFCMRIFGLITSYGTLNWDVL